MVKPFNVLVADPPWPSNPRGDRPLPYKTMTVPEIMRMSLDFPVLSEHVVLFLWRLASRQEEAIAVCRNWGFRPFGELIWNKRTKNDLKWFGQGKLVRSSHETCLIGVSPKVPFPKVANIRSTFEAKYTVHSGKPDEFYELVESMLEGPYYELFARRQRPGWTCTGYELGV